MQDEIEEVDMEIDDDSDQETKYDSSRPSPAQSPTEPVGTNATSADSGRSPVQDNEGGSHENSRDNSDDLTDLADRMTGNAQTNSSGSSDPIEVSAAKDVDLRIRYIYSFLFHSYVEYVQLKNRLGLNGRIKMASTQYICFLSATCPNWPSLFYLSRGSLTNFRSECRTNSLRRTDHSVPF